MTASTFFSLETRESFERRLQEDIAKISQIQAIYNLPDPASIINARVLQIFTEGNLERPEAFVSLKDKGTAKIKALTDFLVDLGPTKIKAFACLNVIIPALLVSALAVAIFGSFTIALSITGAALSGIAISAWILIPVKDMLKPFCELIEDYLEVDKWAENVRTNDIANDEEVKAVLKATDDMLKVIREGIACFFSANNPAIFSAILNEINRRLEIRHKELLQSV